MYESESNALSASSSEIPVAVADRFGELAGQIEARTVLPWSEHCTECAWPTCYETCELYSPRQDGKCRRFVDGMVRVEGIPAAVPYLLKIRFKRWGKLWSEGNLHLFGLEEANRLERRDLRVGRLVQLAPLPRRLKNRMTKGQYGRKKDWARSLNPTAHQPTAFVIEAYNPQGEAVDATLTMRPSGERASMPYLERLQLTSGYNRIRTDFASIAARIGGDAEFSVDLTLNEAAEGTTLYFGLVDFVREVSSGFKGCKCLIWDLDNTVWDGTLIEDGHQALRLRPGVREAIETLDRRGILQSVASKNNHEDAMAVLEQLGLAEYFLCPEISWEPKSLGIRRIIRQLNIGADTVCFIDDSPFERSEVSAGCPDVRVLDATELENLLDRKEFSPQLSSESSQRREFYRRELARKDAQVEFEGDYFDFLRSCEIQLNILPFTPERLGRVHELAQRTNQMNFSGNRYTKEQLQEIQADPDLECYVMSCQDKHGEYGVVGFAVIDIAEKCLIDLMFSCRIQGKRVEHAFLAFVIERHQARFGGEFLANLRRTSRNEQPAKVFTDMQFEEFAEEDGVSRLRLASKELADDRVITVNVELDMLCPE